jgi:PPOX class probable F420-dependent enzyme
MTFQLDINNPDQAHTAERLRTEKILWLASVRPDGRPHLVPVWFLWQGETILLFSKPENQKVRNIRQNPAVIVSLDATDHGNDVTVLEGVAQLIDEPDMSTALPDYASKYVNLMADLGLIPETMAAEYSQAIRITITRQLDI